MIDQIKEERQKHDMNCELRGPGGAIDRRCSCGFRALRVELAILKAERDTAQEEAKKLDILLSQASQTSMLNHRAYLEEHDKLITAKQQVATLIEALKLADEGIMRGQACRSEGEFICWTHDVQAYRPSTSI